MKVFDITANGISFLAKESTIKKGVGVDETFNEMVRELYKELLSKSSDTVGCGYSEFNGYKNVGIYHYR